MNPLYSLLLGTTLGNTAWADTRVDPYDTTFQPLYGFDEHLPTVPAPLHAGHDQEKHRAG